MWANNLDKRKKVIKETVVNLVDYSKRELETAASRTEFRNKMGSEYLDFWKKLSAEKSKLFQGQDIGKWRLDSSVLSQVPSNLLLKDESLAKSLMLSEKTKA